MNTKLYLNCTLPLPTGYHPVSLSIGPIPKNGNHPFTTHQVLPPAVSLTAKDDIYKFLSKPTNFSLSFDLPPADLYCIAIETDEGWIPVSVKGHWQVYVEDLEKLLETAKAVHLLKLKVFETNSRK